MHRFLGIRRARRARRVRRADDVHIPIPIDVGRVNPMGSREVGVDRQARPENGAAPLLAPPGARRSRGWRSGACLYRSPDGMIARS